MAMKSLHDLFVHTLRDIYHAEKQGLKAMRQMSRKVTSPELKSLLETHHEETEHQVEELEHVFESLSMRPRGTNCEAVHGLLEEARELMEEAADDRTRDAGIVAAVQAVEHYEIARYGTLVAWGEALGHSDAVEALRRIRDQEMATDQKLSELAEDTLNPAADTGEGEDGGATDGTAPTQVEAEAIEEETAEQDEPVDAMADVKENAELADAEQEDGEDEGVVDLGEERSGRSGKRGKGRGKRAA
ncbi:ferritin-like domain-containing protein [Acuticoccus sp.]|uniref:YciE/YciF ferroxidase family protein n=1 Tax=Acuticoccus sp. TaxID=1904378 RepID=UPI003B515DA1